MKIYTRQTPIGEISSFENDSFTKQIMEFGYYAEQLILDNHLKPIIENCNTVIDIGGHVGYHSIAYSRINPNIKIHTFEAQLEMFKLLKHNVETNNLIDKITVYNTAVGHFDGHINMSTQITDGPNSNTNVEYGTDKELNLGGLSIGFGGEEVKIVKIDSLQFEKIDYIKIDVEGAESLVLMGAENTIKRDYPIICFEFNHKKLSNDFLKSIGFENIPSPIDVLKSWGYTKFTNIPYENIVAEK
jgi:FkbM family methyltransferase